MCVVCGVCVCVCEYVFVCVCVCARVYCLLLNFVSELEGSGLMVMRIGSSGQACVLLLALAACWRPARHTPAACGHMLRLCLHIGQHLLLHHRRCYKVGCFFRSRTSALSLPAVQYKHTYILLVVPAV